MQELLRKTNKHEKTVHKELDNAKHVLQILPEYHWFRQIKFADVEMMGNIGIYDLLLHKRDVSYSVPDLDEWLGNSNLYLIDYSSHYDRLKLSLKLLITESLFYRKLTKISIVRQRSIAEIVQGNLIKHEFYTSKNAMAEASLDEIHTVLFVYGSPVGFRNTISDQKNYQQIRNNTYIHARLQESFIDESADSSRSLVPRKSEIGFTFAWPLNEFNTFLITSLSKKPSKPQAMHGLISSFKNSVNSSLTIKLLKILFYDFYSHVKDTGIFLVKKKHVGVFPKTHSLNQFTITGIE